MGHNNDQNEPSIIDLLTGKAFENTDSQYKSDNPRYDFSSQERGSMNETPISTPDAEILPPDPQKPYPPQFHVIDLKIEDLRVTFAKEKAAWISYFEKVHQWKRDVQKIFQVMRLEVLQARAFKDEVKKLRVDLKIKEKEITHLKEELQRARGSKGFFRRPAA